MRRFLHVLASVVTVFSSGAVWAASAEMLISPTRILMENGSNYATVTIKNIGDATGRYRVDIIDAEMQRSGAVKLLEKGKKEKYSAKDILRISPRSITLRPQEYQAVRLLVRKPKELEEGEYRSHLRFKLTDNNIEGHEEEKKKGLSITPRLVMVIPAIIRYGKTHYQLTIKQAELTSQANHPEKKSMKMVIGLSGNQSVMGDILITQEQNGKVQELSRHAGIAQYRGTEEREITVPLDKAPTGNGKIHIEYREQNKDEKGNIPIMASYDLSS